MAARLGLLLILCLATATSLQAQQRPRARALGAAPGIFRPGTLNAITDVTDVRVGQVTVISGDTIRTGVTAILPHGGNPFLERVPAAMHVGNGFGKLLGVTQVRELGEIETPILLTCTLCVWKAADAMVDWLLALPGMEQVRSINPVVGETNDGALNAIRARPITSAQVREALQRASTGPVEEGAVGAGAGTIAFGWKGGIGTASRVLPRTLGGWTVGVLVQTNFGGVLQIMGAPVGQALGRYSYQHELAEERGDGSVMIVVATDAPTTDRQLERVAARAIMGLARTGSDASNGSGDYVIAFSTAQSVRRHVSLTGSQPATTPSEALSNEALSPVFEATIEATEEAIYNSLFKATTVTSRGRTVEALPIDRVVEILRQHGIRAR